MPKSFIFDWSGTLNNNTKVAFEVFSLMFKELGKEPISEHEMKTTHTVPYMKFWNRYFPDLTKEKQDELFKKYYTPERIFKSKIFPSVYKTLEFLNSLKYNMFIVSSDFLATLLPQIERARISKFFKKVIGQAHEKEESITSIIEEFKLEKDSTYYIGDTEGDIEAGKKVNIRTIGISWGIQHKEILQKANPDFLIDDIIEIKKIL